MAAERSLGDIVLAAAARALGVRPAPERRAYHCEECGAPLGVMTAAAYNALGHICDGCFSATEDGGAC